MKEKKDNSKNKVEEKKRNVMHVTIDDNVYIDVDNYLYEDIERMAKGFEESIQSLSNRIHYSLSSITGGGDHGNVTDALYSIADAIKKLTKEINKNG